MRKTKLPLPVLSAFKKSGTNKFNKHIKLGNVEFYLCNGNMKPGTFKLTYSLGGRTCVAKDDGNGSIKGPGIRGMIDYTTGVFDIDTDL